MPSPRSTLSLALALTLLVILLSVATFSASAQTPSGDKITNGARIYAENCQVCHGPNGEGRVGATLNKDWPSIRPDLTVKTIIENGVPGSAMPAWSQANGGPLSSDEIDDLVFYILSWQTGGPSQVTPWPTATRRPPISPIPEVQGDPNNGAQLYDQNCFMCHGPDGEGRIGATLAKNWPGIRPDLSVKTTIQNGIPGSHMPAWSQANGGPLNETQIDDLVAYIMTLREAPIEQVQPTEPPPFIPSWLSGWGGVILFIVLLVVILGGAILLQRKPSE